MAAKIIGLLIGYHARWSSEPLETVAAELEFRDVPIINPDTGSKSRTFTQAGKLDGVVRSPRGKFMIEHKTSGEDIEDQSGPYWQRLAIDSQISMYSLAHWQDDSRLDGCIYDVIRKPTIHPKLIPAGSEKKTAEENVGTLREIIDYSQYYGFDITEFEHNEAVITVVNKSKFKETPELYSRRVAIDCLQRPNRYYQRQTITRHDWKLEAWAHDLWNITQVILLERRLSGLPRQNTRACFDYSRPCAYLGICSGHDEPDSNNWENRKRHMELDDDGLDVLTNSRIGCYNTCPRKHYYRYELSIQRRDEEQSEALFFGSAFHLALEAWLNARKGENDGDNTEKNILDSGHSEKREEFAF
jgi:hypothetical protein